MSAALFSWSLLGALVVGYVIMAVIEWRRP